MTPERHRRAGELFHAALTRAAAEQRAFLEHACGGDRDLLAEVESLLAQHRPSSGADPTIAARSVVLSLDPEAVPGGGVRLRDLAGEPPLPELQMGPERYRILGKLGEGAMGEVHLAYDQDLKRRVALKVVKTKVHAMRFLEEAQVIAQLEHPSIVAVHEVGVTGSGKLYYTMPVVRGRTLGAVLEALRGGDPGAAREFPLARRMQVFTHIGQAVSYAHAKGVVHRDLKPGNVMLGSHGEVQVLDWGLSKVIEPGAVETASPASLTADGHIVGTPWYMSPEQASGADVDGRTDVWSLGVILYELLCLERPFHGNSPSQVIASLLRDEPETPSRRAPGASIPLELEAACLGALRKPLDERSRRVDEMVARVQTWLDAEADRTRRHERAEERAAEGRLRLEEYRRLKEEVSRLETEAAAVALRFKDWQSIAEKRELLAAEERAAAARRRLPGACSEAVSTLVSALAFEAEHPRAREGLADYYWERFVEAEARRDDDDRDYCGRMVAAFDAGKYAAQLRGDGSLALSTDPPGADVRIHPLVEQDLRLVPGEERRLGASPVGPVALGMGSYVVVLRLTGRADVRYPIRITRSRALAAGVRLPREDEVEPGFVYVPAGPALLGDDRERTGEQSLPRGEVAVDDFFIGRDPVTLAEYLEWLDALSSLRPDEALARSPRTAAGGRSYLESGPDGRLRLPVRDAEGDVWDARWPVFGVSWHDAIEYAGWRSGRDGRGYRLPSEVEWEKAARGVDGRLYPWGDRFDASLANLRRSRRDRTSPARVDEFPDDVSVYGVRGMCGNVRDWTATAVTEGEGDGARTSRVIRGGAWNGTLSLARCSAREWNDPSYLNPNFGFRLAYSAESPD